MGWVTQALHELAEGREAHVRPMGGSMRGRIKSGQLVTIAPVDPSAVDVDDVVLVKWRAGYLLHLVKQRRDGRFLIGNNIGRINGWVGAEAIKGKVVRVGE